MNNNNSNTPQITSAVLGIESRNSVLNTITKQLDNLQQILLNYNKAFTIPIQSLTNTINTYSSNLISPQLLWDSILNDIQNCLILQEKMSKEIINHKNIADDELSKIKQTIITLKQQQQIQQIQQQPNIVLINQQNPINPINYLSVSKTINIGSPQQSQQGQQMQPILIFGAPPNFNNNNSRISNAQFHVNNNNNNNNHQFIPIPHPINPLKIPINLMESNNAIVSDIKTPQNVSEHIKLDKLENKRKRKRRGYNGPYSEEEKNFMINFDNKQTTEDIINLSNEMEKKFKVKRSPYGLAQKMYQMGVINSRLKAIFQRQFQNENNNKSLDGATELNLKAEISNNSINITKDTSSINSTESNGSCGGMKRRPFITDELNYINQLIINYPNEQPRKLFWRFIQKFADWNNDSKSYQKFYHKYWTLTNEKKEKNKDNDNNDNNNNTKDAKQEEYDNVSDYSNDNNKNERKRSYDDALNELSNPPNKKIKLSK